MPATNLGLDYDLAKRLAAVERAVKLLAGNQLAQAFSATQSDGSVGLSITQASNGATSFRVYQGPSTARDPNTGLHAALLYIGQLVVNGQPSTSGLILTRPTGKQIMTAGAGGFGLFDAQQNLIFAPDETSGVGIALPWLALPTPQPLGTSTWPGTTSTSWTAIAQASVNLQQPKIRWSASVYCPPGVSGEVQLMLPSGVPLGQVWPCGPGFTGIGEVCTVPAGTAFLAETGVIVNAAVTAGSGQVQCQVFGLWGRQS